MHKSHRLFFLLGLVLLFAVLFLFLYYQTKYKPLPPKPPVVSYRIPASDSLSYGHTFLYDFENFGQTGYLSTIKSHSGKYSVMVKGNNNYSLTIQKPIAEIGFPSITEACFGAWICGENDKKINGKLIFQLVSETNALKFTSEVPLVDAEAGNEPWFYISGKAEFHNYKPSASDIVKVYFCNQSNTEVFLDDVILTFGKETLKGNIPLTDMTVKDFKFLHQSNQPPYPRWFAENTVVNPCLSIQSMDGKESLILNGNDEFLSGKFMPSANNQEQVLLIRANVPIALIWYHPDKKQFYFKKTEFKLNDVFANSAKSVIADINGDGFDEFIYLPGDTSRMQVFAFNKVKENADCIFNGNCPVEKVITHISKIKIHDSKKENLLALANNGEAFLLDFDKNTWHKKSIGFLATGSEVSQQSNMVCGNFISELSPNILMLYQGGRSRKCYLKMFSIDAKEGFNTCLYQANFDNKCDTLYPDNTYFVTDLDGDGKSELISYRHEWRFDMKLISFTEKAYDILANIDFKGYQKDYNPKYYENLLLCMGNFSGRKSFSIFTACMNHSIITDLPDGLGLYSLINPESIDHK